MNLAFMREAIRLSRTMMRRGRGGPFGALVVKRGKVVGRGWNKVTSAHDPTAHAEIVAIRQACRHLREFHLTGCQLYTSCEPCPMCLAAIYWAHIDRVYYANTRRDAARIGFDDEWLYREVARPIRRRKLVMRQLLREEAVPVFVEWDRSTTKQTY